MPVYEYVCTTCRNRFEKLRTMDKMDDEAPAQTALPLPRLRQRDLKGPFGIRLLPRGRRG